VAGMQQVCFKQKFNSDDVTKIQLFDDTGVTYQLVLKDEDDAVIDYIDFVEDTDYYTVEIDFADYPDNEFIKLFITSSVGNVYYLAPDTGWTTDGSYTAFNVYGSTNIAKSAPTVADYGAHQPAVLLSGDVPDPITVPIVYVHGGVGSNYLRFQFIDAGGTAVSEVVVELTASMATSLSITFPALSANSDRFRIIFESLIFGSTITIIPPVGDIMLLNDYAAKSDLLHIADHDDTVLIQYGDKANYAGIDYSNEDIFAIRLDGRFTKERTPEENESDQTSDGTVEKLSSTLKDQKLLEIEYAPPHIHKLMKRVLNHNTIYIDGEYWVKEENYEARDVSNSQPLQPATCWLTQKEDGYNTNVYGTVTTI
jgi:hypothetical protein